MVLFWPHTHGNILIMPFILAIEGLSFGFGVPFIMLNSEIFLTNEFPKKLYFYKLFYKLPESAIFELFNFFHIII